MARSFLSGKTVAAEGGGGEEGGGEDGAATSLGVYIKTRINGVDYCQRIPTLDRGSGEGLIQHRYHEDERKKICLGRMGI